MKQIYHNHKNWEEVKYGMYESIISKSKDQLIQKVIYFFNNISLVEKYMAFVVDTFKCSCEHNFTNPSINKRAFLGQAALAVYDRIPREITMIAWNYLDENTQNVANNIADKEIERWKKCQKNI